MAGKLPEAKKHGLNTSPSSVPPPTCPPSSPSQASSCCSSGLS
uniref:Uncharacterized protein n=1 Tax=Arundo donax TaxID=35708 RepID=A0A0A9DSQ9_ARUDO